MKTTNIKAYEYDKNAVARGCNVAGHTASRNSKCVYVKMIKQGKNI
jgi:hypothetical protein